MRNLVLVILVGLGIAFIHNHYIYLKFRNRSTPASIRILQDNKVVYEKRNIPEGCLLLDMKAKQVEINGADITTIYFLPKKSVIEFILHTKSGPQTTQFYN